MKHPGAAITSSLFKNPLRSNYLYKTKRETEPVSRALRHNSGNEALIRAMAVMKRVHCSRDIDDSPSEGQTLFPGLI